MMRCLTVELIEECARYAKTGNYKKLSRACHELANKQLDLMTVTPEKLETIHGIGPKTSRFFIMWIRPHERYAALDVHILRWMAREGYTDVPKSTSQNPKQYARLEKLFIAAADFYKKTPRQLDMEIWEAGAGRTQTTPLPENQA